MTPFKNCPFCDKPPRHRTSNPGFWPEAVVCDHCEFNLHPRLWERRAPVKLPDTPEDRERADMVHLGRAYQMMVEAHKSGLVVNFMTGDISLPKYAMPPK